MDTLKQELRETFSSLADCAAFCTSGSLPLTLPGLEVEELGSVGFPISTVVAKQLIKRASRAPYGRGEETLVDTTVRRVWQLEPSQFVLENPEWPPVLEGIVKLVKSELGISGTVTSDLYKLLIYEKGSFFAPHRDSEKIEGMFATLVVCLPSAHEGGILVVNHDGRAQEIDFTEKENAYRIQYVAFYADCQHEIKPVTKGYRVCLVYNLALATRKRQPQAPQNRDQIEKLMELLSRWFEEPEQEKLALRLTHNYTEAGLSWDALKGEDRAFAALLREVARSLNYHLYLCLMKFHQQGEADYDTFEPSWGYRRSSRWDYYEEDEEDEEDEESSDDTSGVGIAEVYEEELSLEQWIDVQGTKQNLGVMDLEKKELLSDDALDDLPFRQRVHEATGNEGVTVERWYHDAVLVLWPEDRFYGILAQQGQAASIPILLEKMAKVKTPFKDGDCLQLAREIILNWHHHHGMFYKEEQSQSPQMLELLEKLANEELISQFLREVLPRDYQGSEGATLSRLCTKFRWVTFQKELAAFVTAQTIDQHASDLEKTASIIRGLCTSSGRMTAERRTVCSELAKGFVDVLRTWDSKRSGAPWFRTDETRKGVLEAMVRVCAAVDEPDVIDAIFTHAFAQEKRYSLHEVLIPAIKQLRQSRSSKPGVQQGQQRLLEHCIEQLEARTAKPVQPPKDWAQKTRLKCDCKDCQMLQQFIADPKERVGRFPMAKYRRQHLHRIIDSSGCDMTHVTERQGSPQTLVCTKTRATYERKQQQFATDTKVLKELRAMRRAGKK